jgi:hypothetical protein
MHDRVALARGGAARSGHQDELRAASRHFAEISPVKAPLGSYGSSAPQGADRRRAIRGEAPSAVNGANRITLIERCPALP